MESRSEGPGFTIVKGDGLNRVVRQCRENRFQSEGMGNKGKPWYKSMTAAAAVEVAKARKSRGLDIGELAGRTQLHPALIRKIESGSFDIPFGALLEISYALEIQPHKIIEKAEAKAGFRPRPD